MEFNTSQLALIKILHVYQMFAVSVIIFLKNLDKAFKMGIFFLKNELNKSNDTHKKMKRNLLSCISL